MVGVIQVTGTSISVLVVDKFGRRKLLILSELFIGFAFCMLGSFFFVQVVIVKPKSEVPKSRPKGLGLTQ